MKEKRRERKKTRKKKDAKEKRRERKKMRKKKDVKEKRRERKKNHLHPPPDQLRNYETVKANTTAPF